jgi:hypothetical protein
VSAAKFEALSASLLARKGDAAPSVIAPMRASPRRALAPSEDRAQRAEPPPFALEPRRPDNADRPRRILVSITREDLERLCIVAIKKGSTRQDIVQGALHDYLRKLSAELGQACACLEVGSCRSGTAC